MDIVNQLWASVQQYLPNVLAGVAVLVAGWLAALVIAAIVRGILRRTTIDNRIARWLAGDGATGEIPIERFSGRIAFVVVMVFVLVAFFQVVGLTMVTQPLNELLEQIFAFLPRALGAAAVVGVAWIVASGLRLMITRVLARTGLEARVREEQLEGDREIPLGKAVGDAVYWLVFLLFLPAVLGALALEGLLAPVQALVNEVLEYVPNVATAGLILLVGWFVARLVQRILANLSAAVGVDQLGTRVGFDRALGGQRLSGLLGLVVYVLILIPVLVAALDALGIDAVTRPVSNVLDTILAVLPSLFASVVVLAIAYAIGKIVSGLVANLLAGAGFDRLVAKLAGEGVKMSGASSPSVVVGHVVLVATLVFASIEAFSLLGFAILADLLTRLGVFGVQIVVAIAVLAAGLYLAHLAYRAIAATGSKHRHTLALVARAAILLLAGAMALGQLGVAAEIITLAFGLTLGAVAVAAAVAFGIGGRDLAARQLDAWYRSLEGPDR